MGKDGTPTREDRLKAALKANMARRKAQKRARAEEETPPRPKGDGERKDERNG